MLFHLWEPAPFLFAAAIVSVACLVPVLFLREDGGHGRVFEGVATYIRHSWRVLRRNPDVGRFLLANTAWEGTFAGARTFVVLYITVGLGEPLWTSTLVLTAVAGGYMLAALVSGSFGDRFGLARVITWCSVVYGFGLFGGGFATQWHAWYLAVIFVVAIFGGSVMTLSWGLLFKLMPPDERGAISGLATTTKGFGLIFGMLLAGIVIDVMRPRLPATHGYQVLWPILALPILLAIPLVFSLIRAEELRARSGYAASSSSSRRHGGRPVSARSLSIRSCNRPRRSLICRSCSSSSSRRANVVVLERRVEVDMVDQPVQLTPLGADLVLLRVQPRKLVGTRGVWISLPCESRGEVIDGYLRFLSLSNREMTSGYYEHLMRPRAC